MKLYTEEQVERAIDLAKRNVSKNRIVESLTPIELPSDEEIENSSWEKVDGNEYDILPAYEFQRGAKYVIDKIQGGNK
jgi:hypothetical protein